MQAVLTAKMPIRKHFPESSDTNGKKLGDNLNQGEKNSQSISSPQPPQPPQPPQEATTPATSLKSITPQHKVLPPILTGNKIQGSDKI
jgi:hypothetical protein